MLCLTLLFQKKNKKTDHECYDSDNWMPPSLSAEEHMLLLYIHFALKKPIKHLCYS